MTATGDLFTPIHKGLRSMIYGLSARLQTNDFADIASTKALFNDLETDFAIAQSAGCILCIFSHHAHDEEAAIFSDAAKAGSELVATLIEEHHDLARREAELARSGHRLLAMERPNARAESGIRLNQSANELFAAYLTHMNREESALVPWMRDHFSDAQMAAMQGAIMGRMPPDRLFAIAGWMLPSLNVRELAQIIQALRHAMPPAAFQVLTDLCAARVDSARWDEVQRTIGLPNPTPGAEPLSAPADSTASLPSAAPGAATPG
jgi:hypothetical protein